MKECTYCGKEYPDEAEVCAIDHEPLKKAGVSFVQLLIEAGLKGDFDTAAQKRDLKQMVAPLVKIGMSKLKAGLIARAILAKPERYGC